MNTVNDKKENVQFVDIEEIKNRANSSKADYSLFEKLGMKYGPAFRVVNDLYYTESESLSYLELPAGQINDFDPQDYIDKKETKKMNSSEKRRYFIRLKASGGKGD